MTDENEKVTLAEIKKDLDYIKAEIHEVKTLQKEDRKKNEDTYVTKTQFEPVRLLVYGFAGLVLITAVGALLRLVVKQ